MKYVLDASVALKWVLQEQNTDKALRLRDAYRQNVHKLIAPDFFRAECGHALFRAERRRLLASGQPGILLATILINCPELRDIAPYIPRAVLMADQIRIGFYDAIYMALAEAENCSLITADARLLNAVHARFHHIVDLAAMP